LIWLGKNLSNANKRHYVIVAHGSRSREWTRMVEDWFAGVRSRVDAPVHLAFLEYSSPLFSNVLASLDMAGNEILILPFFLTASGHREEDVPAEATAALKRAHWSILEPAGLEAEVGRNAERRLRELGAVPGEPVVVSGYGAPGASGEAAWAAFVDTVRSGAGEYANSRWTFAPSGHFLSDSEAPLRARLAAAVHDGSTRLSVLPLYVSVSSYQKELIPKLVAELPAATINFRPNAILPDEALEQWAARLIANFSTANITAGR
jgi:sirohydrochlorin ferrochelatase